MKIELTEADRAKILKTIRRLVPAKHINVANPHQNYDKWVTRLDERTPALIRTHGTDEFEHGVREVLAALESSHTGFFHSSGRDVPAPHAIHATLRAIDVPAGRRWMFLDVIEDGIAATAGIRPGDLLLAADSVPSVPPEKPRFQLGVAHRLLIGSLNGADSREVILGIPSGAPKDRPPMIEPRSISHRILEPGIGYIRVAAFPGAVGLDFARDLDAVIRGFKQHQVDRLIIDLRGNIGGGLGSLRLMSYLCPGKVPIGHSLTRRRLQKGYSKDQLVRIDKIPTSKWALALMALRFTVLERDRSMVLATEGLGPQPFHGKIVILINEFTHSAAEMVARFAADNQLATLVGTQTSGEVLGGANFRLAKGYRLRMPVAGWYTWNGECIEGMGITPDIPVELSADALARNRDEQLLAAMNTIR